MGISKTWAFFWGGGGGGGEGGVHVPATFTALT